jgi:hypothetical protein
MHRIKKCVGNSFSRGYYSMRALVNRERETYSDLSIVTEAAAIRAAFYSLWMRRDLAKKYSGHQLNMHALVTLHILKLNTSALLVPEAAFVDSY